MYVSQDGLLYALPRESFEKYLRACAAGNSPRLLDFNAMLIGDFAGDVGHPSPLTAALFLRFMQEARPGDDPPDGASKLEVQAWRVASIFDDEEFGLVPAQTERAA